MKGLPSPSSSLTYERVAISFVLSILSILFSRYAGLGVSIADAPVSGGPGGASAGTLTTMVGGTLGSFDMVQVCLLSISVYIQSIFSVKG